MANVIAALNSFDDVYEESVGVCDALPSGDDHDVSCDTDAKK
jgi:hypothetical protein